MGKYGGTDLFECPDCRAMIPRTAEKCPGCGKVFQPPAREDEGLDFPEATGMHVSWADHTTCAKCGGVLEKGFLDDQLSDKAYLDLMWTSGGPEDETHTPEERRHFYVTAVRCTRCGNLELKALDRPRE
jgi:hypothetical protein